MQNTRLDDIIERDPTVALVRPKAHRSDECRPLTPEETKRVLQVARTHPDGLILAVLYYLGVRRGEALGLKWGDFDWNENQVHIQRNIDFTTSKATEGALKTAAAERFVPVPDKLREMLLPLKARPEEYIFRTETGEPISQASFKQRWCRLMLAVNCVEWKKPKPDSLCPDDILKCIKPTLSPHCFRHNYAMLLFVAGVDPLIIKKIIGLRNCQTIADVYTHKHGDMLKKATVNMGEVFRKQEG